MEARKQADKWLTKKNEEAESESQEAIWFYCRTPRKDRESVRWHITLYTGVKVPVTECVCVGSNSKY